MKIFRLVILFNIFGCTSTYHVIDVKTSPDSEINYIYIEDYNKEHIYELTSIKRDTLISGLRKISKGDNLKIKLIRRNNFQINEYNSGVNEFEEDTLINNIIVNKKFYSPDIYGIYYLGSGGNGLD